MQVSTRGTGASVVYVVVTFSSLRSAKHGVSIPTCSKNRWGRPRKCLGHAVSLSDRVPGSRRAVEGWHRPFGKACLPLKDFGEFMLTHVRSVDLSGCRDEKAEIED